MRSTLFGESELRLSHLEGARSTLAREKRRLTHAQPVPTYSALHRGVNTPPPVTPTTQEWIARVERRRVAIALCAHAHYRRCRVYNCD